MEQAQHIQARALAGESQPGGLMRIFSIPCSGECLRIKENV
jgi:hypothetical protein